jgi:hypothetical protein
VDNGEKKTQQLLRSGALEALGHGGIEDLIAKMSRMPIKRKI